MATESVGSWAGAPHKLVPSSMSPFREEKKISPNTPDRPRYRKNDICYHCKQEGHWSMDCPDNNKDSPMSSPSKAFPKCPQNYPELLCINCRQPCIVRTSGTDKNPGRDFYTCPRGSICKMFQWGDEVGKIWPRAVNSPVKTVQEHGSAALQNPKCTCGAGPCRVLMKQSGPYKGRKYFACNLRMGDGRCVHSQWCDAPGENFELEDENEETVVPTVTTPPLSPPATLRAEHEVNSVGLGTPPTKRKRTVDSPPATLRAEHEANSVGLGTPPTKCKRTVDWTSEHIGSLSLNCYLSEEPNNLETNKGKDENKGEDTGSGETFVLDSPPPRRNNDTNNVWPRCSLM